VAFTTPAGCILASVYPFRDGFQVGDAYIWGAQLEAGSFITSYISTTSAATTRAQDNASVNTLTPWYNATAGTLFTEASQPVIFNSSKTASSINDNASSRFSIYRQAAGGVNGFVTPGSGAIASGITATANTAWKGALAYNTTTGFISVNGASVVSGAHTISLGALTNLCVGNSTVGGSDCWNGYIRLITYYPRQLNNSELQAATV
jgi:hypothetical protein